MRHPTEGTLRRLIDEPAGVSDADRRHVAGCPQCAGALATIGEDAALVHAALGTDSQDVDTDKAWQRLSGAVLDAQPARREGQRMARSHRRSLGFLKRPLVAAAVVLAVLAGGGTAAANGWLQIFRTEQIAPVNLSTADLIALPDLSAYGDLVMTGGGDLHGVPDAATAAAQTGLDVPDVSELPKGVSGDPVLQVVEQISATFTFSAAKTAAAAGQEGNSLPPMPPGLDGNQVRLVAGPGVAQVWSQAQGVPSLLVGRAVAPTAFSSGVPFETVRDYLLSLPGLPDQVAAQLRTFSADGSTLPLPVPADQVDTSSADVNGVSATVLTRKDRTMAAVVWVADGVLTAVAGPLDADEVLLIARNLR